MPLELETSETVDDPLADIANADWELSSTVPFERHANAVLNEVEPPDYDDAVQAAETTTDEIAASPVESPTLADAVDFAMGPIYIPAADRFAIQRAKEIEAARDRLCAATMTERHAKAALKIAKGEREAASEALADLLIVAESTREGEKKPPASPTTDAPPVETKPGEPPPIVEPKVEFIEVECPGPPRPPTATSSATGVNAPNAAWRFFPIDQLEGLPPGIIKALADAGLDTVGKLADYTKSGQQLIDIKGIGEAKVEKIEKACEDFWKAFLPEKVEAAA